MNDVTSVPSFEFATARRIIFGDGRSDEAGRVAASLAANAGDRRVLMVTGRKALTERGIVGRLAEALSENGFAVSGFSVSGEPTVSVIDAGVGEAKRAHASLVIALGGGSVIDAGKGIACLFTNGGRAIDYLEGVGAGRKIEQAGLPLIAMPTTAGTGSEATKNAVVSAEDGSFKKSMRSEHLLPRIALVDPVLTHSMPQEITAYSGLDALTQLIESYTSNGASPMTDALAERGIRLAARSLVRAYEHPTDGDARRDMALAALLGGMCLANAGLGAAHGIVSPLGAHYPVPHGAGCAALLPHVVEMNIRCLRAEDTRGATLERYRRVGEMFGSDADGLPVVLGDLVRNLRVPGLASWGLTPDGVPTLVQGSRGSSMRYNPVVLSDEDIAAILEAAM